MEKVDQVITYLAYARRTILQLLDLKNLRHSHLVFRGFTPDKGHYYDFKKYGYKSYVKDTTRYLKTVFINYHNRNLIADKYGCYLLLKEFTDKAVPVYGLIDNGELFFVGKYKTIEELFTNESKLVLKPRVGRGGSGVKVVTVNEGKIYINQKECSSFLSAIKGVKNYILVPYVIPHPYSAKVFPGSVNTIRLVTCLLDGKVVLLSAGHRFGAEYRSNVDNGSQGGISARVNLDTGILEDTVAVDMKNRKKIKADRHPLTDEPILGLEVPGWKNIRDEVIEIHESLRFIKYVGWDIALTPESFRIIEANYASDLHGLQLHSPLLLEEKNVRFFSKYE